MRMSTPDAPAGVGGVMRVGWGVPTDVLLARAGERGVVRACVVHPSPP